MYHLTLVFLIIASRIIYYEAQQVDKNGNPVIIVSGNKTFQYQQANALLYGMNTSLNIHPANLKGFSFNNSFSLVYGFNLNPKFKNVGINGEYLPFIPPLRLLSSVGYDIPIKGKTISMVHLKTEVDCNAAQYRYLGLYQTETSTAAYTLLNASVLTDINFTRKYVMRFQLTVNNVLNTAYQSHLSRLQYFEYYTQSPKGHLGIYNMGRNICMKLIFPF
jgi:iron complex outermembrane receptor protein